MPARILAVDDEVNILAALEGLFAGEEDISVVTARNGVDAIELMASQPVDLIISDRMMPMMDGLTLLTEARKLFPDVPRVLLTGDESFTTAQAVASLGEDVTVVHKPWDVSELRKCVREALASRQSAQEQDALRQHGGITPEQLRRAERIRKRMQQTRPIGEILVELGEMTRTEYERIVRMRRSRLSLVDLLKEDGHLREADYRAYQEAKRKAPGLSDRALLVDSQLVTEEQFLRALAVKHDVPYVEPEVGSVDAKLLNHSSLRYLMHNRALPVRVTDGKLEVILANPLDNQLRTELERQFQMPVVVRCCTSERINEALRTLERLRAREGGGATSLQYREIEDLPATDDSGEEAVQIVDYLLMRAIQLRASDLHIEPAQTKIRVRVRVDGVLQQLTDLPVDFAPRVVSRIKILAGADIAERRMHQDGKIFVKVEGREIDIRVSTYASVFGENLVLRLLDRNRGLSALHEIGFTPRAHMALEDVVLESSSGLVLVVGPTGSGKTTTLYSFIAHANDPTEKVITCEDPVEYVMDGVIQCSVNEKTGPTFQDSLRAIVRQDPDTIVVGEMRDKATVSLALESALTGHKVFSTFHTEDAVGAFVRLLDMGAEPFLVASTVSAVVAQRLVRRICPNCRKPATPSGPEMRFLGLDRSSFKGAQFWAAGSCSQCQGTGFRGRLAIHEVLIPDDDFRDTILRRAPAKELRQAARRLAEFLTLQEDALLKAAAGSTTLAEIVSNAPRDTSARPLSQLQTISKSPKTK